MEDDQMAHLVVSVSQDTKDRLNVLRDQIEEANGYRISYNDVIKMLLKIYADGQVKDDRQIEMDFDEDKSDIFARLK
tara:strand:- start:267 stop:497 length:231 start_codon:yes stop_codon:yes gene_type:complete